jgi:hypothetical protein
MKSCYFVFSQSVLLFLNMCSINLHNSLRTCSILVLVLSAAEPSLTLFRDGFVSLTHGFSAMTDCKPSQSQSQSQRHIATDDQSVSKSWYRAPSWGPWPDFFFLIWKFLSCLIGAPSLTRGRVCHLSVIVRISKSIVSIHIYLQI